MRAALGLARADLLVWLATPWTIAAAVFPPVGMGLLVGLLTLSVGQQPVALVVEGKGPLANHMARIIAADEDAYLLSVLPRGQAMAALTNQQVAAVILIPADFDAGVAQANAKLTLFLNNVDIDFADDIRRAVDRSIAEFDAPQLGRVGQLHGPSQGVVLPNPYRVAIAEENLRSTTVSFLEYELVPVLVLLPLSLGLLAGGTLASRDWERGTASILLASPADLGWIIVGRVLSGVVATLAILVPATAGLALVGILHPPASHWPEVTAILGGMTLMAVSWGTALGLLVKRSRWASILGLNLAIYLFFLGGGFTTVAFLPEWLQAASRALPTSYAIEGLRQSLFYTETAGLSGDLLAPAIAIAAGFGAAALSITLRRRLA